MAEEIKKFELSNRLFYLLTILLIGILIFFGAEIFFAFKNLPDHFPREISVTGEGRAFVTPDIALVRLGVTTEGMKIQEIVKKNSEKMNNILKEIKDLGIEEKDIRTVRYNLAPRYEWKEGERIFKGYSLTQEIRVKIRNLEKIGQVLGKATKLGANLIGDLQFTIDDPEKVREIARKEAIEKAKEKAALIASQTGLKLVKIINLYEEHIFEPKPYFVAPLEGMGRGGAPPPVPPEIQPGEEEVIVKVTLVYRVK